jgi:hypothetical protein
MLFSGFLALGCVDVDAVAGVITHRLEDYNAYSPHQGSDFLTGTLLTEVDLFQIDLGALISRYIGDTEEQLDHLFDRAAKADVTLFIDEADAVIGKRTDVRDSHDRYAEDFVLLDPSEGTWHGQIFLDQSGLTPGVYELSGTFTVPEPSSLATFGIALLCAEFARRRHKARVPARTSAFSLHE